MLGCKLPRRDLMVTSSTPKSQNFGFLAESHAHLHRVALDAERSFASDPSTTIFKMRLFAEGMAKHAAASIGVYAGSEVSQHDLLRTLENRSMIERDTARIFHRIRVQGNRAAHEIQLADGHRVGLEMLKFGRELAVWFMRSFGQKPNFKVGAFQKPADPTARQRELDDEVGRLRAELAETKEGAALQAELAASEAAAREEAERAQRLSEDERDIAFDLAAEQERQAQSYAAKAARAAEQAASTKAEREAAQAQATAAEELLQATRETLLHEAERRAAELEKNYEAKLAQLQAGNQDKSESDLAKQIAISAAATSQIDLSEAETRLLIDDQLFAAGWMADTQKLRYSAGTRPQKGQNLAIAEWPTSSGPADYVLFIGLHPVAVVEAKKKATNVSGALTQSKRYARDYVVLGDEKLCGPALTWTASFTGWPTTTDGNERSSERYKVPFLFATNGREYHQQVETESGIWFLDARVPTNHARALVGWYTPEGIKGLLEQNEEDAHKKLHAEPTDYLELRDYQLKAIQKVEDAIEAGQRKVLLAMATGTGKTRTIIGLIYRLLKSGRFRRVLFLVDRSALGEQAQNAFKDMRLEANQTFNEIFEVKELGDIKPDSSTRVHVATVQGMVKRCLWPSSDDDGAFANTIPVDEYDAIIVDESHRGYNLDQEMGDGEMEVRALADYISTYRRVLDYFDAVRIGLTATPALHTVKIFGEAVFTYDYREAVVDGWLIDHEPPFRITTKLSEKGIKLEKGDEVTVIKRDQSIQLSLLPDDLDFEVADFNKKVIAPGYTKAVCEVLAKHIDPNGPEKTLIFCVTDKHADRVVEALKKALVKEWGEVDDSAVQKITGKTDKCMEVFRKYRNDNVINIAVTVDLLTTGIDVPAICNLVFLRRVRSRILYAQMKGRATRRCDQIGKDVFRIFDAVDLFAALEDIDDMKPVVTSVNLGIETLIAELQSDVAFTAKGREQGASHADDVLDQIVTRLRRQAKRALQVTKKSKVPPASWGTSVESLSDVTGHDPEGLADSLNKMSATEARAYFDDKPQLGKVLTRLFKSLQGHGRGDVFLHDEADQALPVTRGYGAGEKPEEYLAAFKAFVQGNRNKMAALNVVMTRPRELTRAQLKELRIALSQNDFTSSNLRAAWKDWKQEDVAASIIGWIRQQALGSTLLSYEERVDRALKKVLAMQSWSKAQEKWLLRIAKQLKEEMVIDNGLFDDPAFKAKGGYARVDKDLGGQLEQVLDAFGDGIWEEAA